MQAKQALHIRLGFWDVESKYFDYAKPLLTRALKRWTQLDIVTIKDLEEASSKSCDIVCISASHVPKNSLTKWLTSLAERFQSNQLIWVPALILSEHTFDTGAHLAEVSSEWNWYYDLLMPNHLDSIPVRVANLVKIHQHLRELRRYDKELKQLSSEVHRLNQELSKLKGHHGSDS